MNSQYGHSGTYGYNGQGQRPATHPQQSSHQYYPLSPGRTHGASQYPSQGQGTQFGYSSQRGHQGEPQRGRGQGRGR